MAKLPCTLVSSQVTRYMDSDMLLPSVLIWVTVYRIDWLITSLSLWWELISDLLYKNKSIWCLDFECYKDFYSSCWFRLPQQDAGRKKQKKRLKIINLQKDHLFYIPSSYAKKSNDRREKRERRKSKSQ